MDPKYLQAIYLSKPISSAMIGPALYFNLQSEGLLPYHWSNLNKSKATPNI